MSVWIDPKVEMVETFTFWIWARTEHGHEAGDTVPENLRKRIFKSWVDAGWVLEAEGQTEMW